MTEGLLQTLEKLGQQITIPTGQTVFSEGDTCQQFVLIKSGSIKVFKNSEKGREFVLYRVTPDHLCVLTTSCILSNMQYSANAITESDVFAIAINKKNFDELIINSAEFRELVFASLSKRLNQFVEKIDEIVFFSLKERLVEFLKKRKNDSNRILMTHQEIAAELGTDREVISRILSSLKKEGFIQLQKGEIHLQ